MRHLFVISALFWVLGGVALSFGSSLRANDAIPKIYVKGEVADAVKGGDTPPPTSPHLPATTYVSAPPQKERAIIKANGARGGEAAYESPYDEDDISIDSLTYVGVGSMTTASGKVIDGTIYLTATSDPSEIPLYFFIGLKPVTHMGKKYYPLFYALPKSDQADDEPGKYHFWIWLKKAKA